MSFVNVYGFSGAHLSVRESIGEVLGFDFGCNLALGLSAFLPLKGKSGKYYYDSRNDHGIINPKNLS